MKVRILCQLDGPAMCTKLCPSVVFIYWDNTMWSFLRPQPTSATIMIFNNKVCTSRRNYDNFFKMLSPGVMMGQWCLVARFQVHANKAHLTLHGETPRDGKCFYKALSSQLDLMGLELHTHTQHVNYWCSTWETSVKMRRIKFKFPYKTNYCNWLLQYIVQCSKILNLKIVIVKKIQDNVVGDGPVTVHLGYLPAISHYVSLKSFTSCMHGALEPDSYYPVF